jgi:hypothetical protein
MMHISFGDPKSPLVYVAGDIRGADVGRFCDVLAQVDARAGQSVYLDLSGVTAWSIVAQAAVLCAARELAAKRCRLVLVGAGLGLRRQSQHLDVFNRVQALGSTGEPWWTDATNPAHGKAVSST